MIIASLREKRNTLLARVPRDVLIIGILLGASCASFALGYLAGKDATLPAQTGQGSELLIDTTRIP